MLMLLVLIQLPKKEAGAGVAFGGGATDALFGAGSGNALTKMTRYGATLFVGLALSLSLLNAYAKKQSNILLEQELQKRVNAGGIALPVPPPNRPLSTITTQSLPTVPAITATNIPRTAISNQAATNITVAPAVPAPPSTNPPAAPPK